MSVYEDLLRTVPLFADLPDPDLTRLCRNVARTEHAAGTELFAEGDRGDHAYVVIDGELEIYKMSAGRRVLLARLGPGTVIGEMALLEDAPRMASAAVTRPTSLLSIPKGPIEELLASSATAAGAMFKAVLDHWRSTEGKLRQSERMAQLGTLSAGIAHELNNPAAAVGRSVERLRAGLLELDQARVALFDAMPDPEQRAAAGRLTEDVLAGSGRRPHIDALARSDREEAIESWLDDHGVPRPWDLAPSLTDLGYDLARLDAVADRFGPAFVAPVARLLCAAAGTAALLHEIEEGTARVTSIVRALKSYSYLDRAPVQDVDVAAGIDDTLLILAPKLVGIRVDRDYDPDLPAIEGYGSELNQVWTNLIDNAADAIAAAGRSDGFIRIRVFPEADDLVVEVEDNGTGIPEEIRHRVFDSFFTTKPPGSGTGLGLDISYGIVVDRHRGDIRVDSAPGRTVFRVSVPRSMERTASAGQPAN